MAEQDFSGERFEASRVHLRSVAYRMLGSQSEADDAVQEAWLRFAGADTREVENLRGWLTTTKGKALLYDTAGTALRDGDCIVHALDTFSQLASIEGSTLRAPPGHQDDRATAFVLALAGRANRLLYVVDDLPLGPVTAGKRPV